MRRILVIAAVSAVVYPSISYLAECASLVCNAEILRMAGYPALVGLAAGALCRRRNPIASAAMAGGVAVLLVGAVGLIATQWLSGDRYIEPTLPQLIEMHAARAIIAMVISGFSAAIIIFAAAFVGKTEKAQNDRRIMFVAGGLAVALWIIIALAWLAS